MWFITLLILKVNTKNYYYYIYLWNFYRFFNVFTTYKYNTELSNDLVLMSSYYNFFPL